MSDLISIMLPEIEAELKRQVSRLDEEHSLPFKEMLSYHMGWTGEGAGAEAAGKQDQTSPASCSRLHPAVGIGQKPFPPLRQSSWSTTFRWSTTTSRITLPNGAVAQQFGLTGALRWR